MYTSRSSFSLNLITNLIACLYIIMISSCHKDPYQDGTHELPPITMEGKNTFGFLLDGKVWVPYQESSGLFTPTLDFGMDGNTLRGEARLNRSTEINQQINLTFTIDSIGIIKVKKDYGGLGFFNNKKVGLSCNEYGNKSDNAIINVLKLDWNNRIIAGTFEFPMMVSGCQDTISITEGRFDLKFK